MDKTVEALAAFAANLRYEDIRPAALHAAKRSIIDSLGCAIAAFDRGTMKSLRRLAGRFQAAQPCSILGCDVTTNPEWAALVNGSQIRYTDFSDDYFGTESTPARGDVGPHPSDNLGGIFAAVETCAGDGKSALLGTVIAYEVCGQFTDNVVVRSKGWDYTIFHAIATALAAGRILGLEKEKLADAVRLAVVPNNSLYETRVGELSHWKGLAGPNGSRNGLFAALLAGEGITGPELAFEGRRGFMRQMGDTFKLSAFGDTKNAFRIENTYFKSMPIRYDLQTSVELALRLHGTLPIGEVASLKVYMNPTSMATRADEPTHWNPMTRETADHSCPYLIGAALFDGKIDDETFTEKRFRDPQILALVDRIEMIPEPRFAEIFPWTMSARFEVGFKSSDVKTFENKNAKGHPQNPFTDAELEQKFFGQISRVMPEGQGRKLLDHVWNLEKSDSLKTLFGLARIP